MKNRFCDLTEWRVWVWDNKKKLDRNTNIKK